MRGNAGINKVLRILSGKARGIDYAFIGSVNLYIQGLKVEPRDIDILTTPEGIKKIDGILGEHRTKEIYFDESEGRNSFRSFYEIEGIEIEVLGNVSNAYRKPESLTERLFIEFDGIKLPCILLASEIETYQRMGRQEKAEMIKKFLRAKERD